MSLINYPLFCWRLDQDAVFGIVPGQDWQMVDSSVSRIKKVFSEWAKREAEEDAYLAEPEIQKPRLKQVRVKLRLAYREKKGLYPLSEPLHLPVAAVYGHNPEEGYWKCYLPLLETEFYYYQEGQLDSLIQHFTRDVLEGAPPEWVHRYLMNSEPWLEEIRVRVNEQTTTSRPDPNAQDAMDRLRGLAERVPMARSRRKPLLPEAAWERAELVEKLSDRLLQEGSNIMLVGQEGVGKTAIWLEVVKRLHHRSKDCSLTFWRTTAERLIADAKYLGEWQEICENTVEDLQTVNGVLWIVDPMTLFRIGGEGVEDSVAAFLLPLIQKGELTLIGEMNVREVEAARHLLPGFLEHFSLITVDELNREKMQKVLGHLGRYVNSLGIGLSANALEAGYGLLARYLRYESFPGKAMRFFADCVRRAQRDGETVIDRERVLQEFIRLTGLPEIILRDEQILPRGQLMDFFQQTIIGQESAVSHLSVVVNTYKAGLNDPDKPIATLLFAGPTGVGKTAAAKALAEFFFKAGQAQEPLFRIDMSEFQHPYQLTRLIGSDRKNPGKLIQHVRNRPFSVILLDEIEKADSSFFDVLLTVLDEGRFVDAFGRVTDFRNTIIVMTSNLGAADKASMGFVADQTRSEEMAVRAFFRPEFYNRIDKVLVFQPLGREAIRDIARRELKAVEQREGVVKRGLKLEFSEALVDFIGDVGFSPRYGARPLQRAIESYVVAGMSRFLLGQRGMQKRTLRVDVESVAGDERVVFE